MKNMGHSLGGVFKFVNMVAIILYFVYSFNS